MASFVVAATDHLYSSGGDVAVIHVRSYYLACVKNSSAEGAACVV